jgi:signal peptidase II
VTARKLRSAAHLRAGALAAVVIGLDQLTKHTVVPSHEQKLIAGLKLVNVRNTGVAFGVFSGGGAFVVIVTLAALALLLFYFVSHPRRRGLWVPTGLLVGGALSNLIDRLANGAVTDFIKLPHWPAFNLADAAITVGVLALVYVLESGRGRAH